METILIVERDTKEAYRIKRFLSEQCWFRESKGYYIEVLEDETSYENGSLCKNIEWAISSSKVKGRPVIGMVLDLFNSRREISSLMRGWDYKVDTVREIIKKYGNSDKNGTFTTSDKFVNIILTSDFPQFSEYTKDLLGDEEWIYFHEMKRLLTGDGGRFIETYNEYELIRKVLTGSWRWEEE